MAEGEIKEKYSPTSALTQRIKWMMSGQNG
jgi:hypothetical protein